MARLKTFVIALGRNRFMVAASTQGIAASLLGTNVYNLRKYGNATGNAADIRLATSQPNVVFIESCHRSEGWTPYTGEPWRKK